MPVSLYIHSIAILSLSIVVVHHSLTALNPYNINNFINTLSHFHCLHGVTGVQMRLSYMRQSVGTFVLAIYSIIATC